MRRPLRWLSVSDDDSDARIDDNDGDGDDVMENCAPDVNG